MSRYAENTSVSAERSRGEIETTLTRYGAHGFMYGWQEREDSRDAMIQFDADGRRIRFVLPLPSMEDPEFHRTPGGRRRRDRDAAVKAWEQACRQRWRALALAIKAKLESVECGITTFEDEFFAHIVLPNGQTVGATIAPQIERAYATGKMPRLLLEAPE